VEAINHVNKPMLDGGNIRAKPAASLQAAAAGQVQPPSA